MKIEVTVLDILEGVLTASFEERNNKEGVLKKVRIKTEILKRLIRIVYNLNIIPSKKYIGVEGQLQEISMMINGWIKYVSKKGG